MKNYVIFTIPGRKFPENIVVKRLRGGTEEKMIDRGYTLFGHIEARSKLNALIIARKEVQKGGK